jgi:hypothetical protein
VLFSYTRDQIASPTTGFLLGHLGAAVAQKGPIPTIAPGHRGGPCGTSGS